MDSVTSDRFWFWFGLLVLVNLVVVILRALAASSFGVRTCRDHHSIPLEIGKKRALYGRSREGYVFGNGLRRRFW